MQLSAEDFFALLAKPELPAAFMLEGSDGYLESEFKRSLKARDIEIHEAEIKKGGPEPQLEDLSMGGSLFSPMSVLWVRKLGPTSSWTDAAQKTWDRIRARADGQHFALFAQIPQDKRYKWNDLGIANKALLSVSPDRRAPWLKRMNERHGGKLDSTRMRYLVEHAEGELVDLDNWVELWNLGGDAWAERALGWGKRGAEGGRSVLKTVWDGDGNPAYAWVDAVLRGDRRKSVVLIDHLLGQGEEALPLLALLTKSVKVLAALETGGDADGQPAFLVQKIRGVLSANRPARPRRGHELLYRCADIDRALKSSGGSPRVLLEQL